MTQSQELPQLALLEHVVATLKASVRVRAVFLRGSLYRGQPDTFKDLVAKGMLPQARAKGCEREYKQIDHAFRKHIGPHIDQKLLKEVQARQWLRPDDGSCVIDRG